MTRKIQNLLLPNEIVGHGRSCWTLFLITFDPDGCEYMSYTDLKFIVTRLSQLLDPDHPYADPDLVLHDQTGWAKLDESPASPPD